MSNPIRMQGAIAPQQEQLCRDFLSAALGRSAENMEMLLGETMSITMDSFTMEHDASLRSRLPATCASLTVTGRSEQDGLLMIVIEPALAQTLSALIRMAAPDEVKRCRQEGELHDLDLDALQGAGSFLVAGLGDEVAKRSKSQIRLEAGECLTMQDSIWDSGEDPILVGTYLVASGSIAIGADYEDTILIAMPWGILADVVEGISLPRADDDFDDEEDADGGDGERPKARVPTTAPAASAVVSNVSDGDLLCIGPSSLRARIADSFGGQPVKGVARISNALSVLEMGVRPSMLITLVNDDEPGTLDLLAAIRKLPQIQDVPLLVLLESPTRDIVLRCGMLRLLDVLPSKVEDELLSRRVASLINAGSGRREPQPVAS